MCPEMYGVLMGGACLDPPYFFFYLFLHTGSHLFHHDPIPSYRCGTTMLMCFPWLMGVEGLQ